MKSSGNRLCSTCKHHTTEDVQGRSDERCTYPWRDALGLTIRDTPATLMRHDATYCGPELKKWEGR